MLAKRMYSSSKETKYYTHNKKSNVARTLNQLVLTDQHILLVV